MKSTSRRTCSACGGSTKDGFLLDRRRELQAQVQQWIEGAPERNWFGSVKSRGRPHANVVVSRCAQCGRLELWAPEVDR